MQLSKPDSNEITFGQDWSVEGIEQSYNTQTKHKIIKIALSKLGIGKLICFEVEETVLIDFPMDPFGITEIVITFSQNSKSGQIHLECEVALESTTISCSDIEIT